MKNKNLNSYPLFKVYINKENCLDEVSTVLESGFMNEGVQVKQLTDRLIPVLGSKNLVLTNSCTSALTMAFKIAGVQNNKNVISSPMTCIASNTPIINLGGNIKWADINPRNGMIDINSIKEKVDKDTVAICFVNWGGVLPNLEELYEFSQNEGIKLIQDAAHSFMAEYNEEPICKYADFTCYSFQAIKHFTCGDGGALIAKDDLDFSRAKKLKWFGYDRDASKDENGNWVAQQEEADIEEKDVGFKFNMNNLSASIGLSNLPKMDSIINKHIANARLYDKHFFNEKKLTLLEKQENTKSVFWVYTIILHESINREEIIKKLNDNNISAGQVHIPNDVYACFKRFKTNLPGVRLFSRSQINLPCGWWLEENDINHIAEVVKKILN